MEITFTRATERAVPILVDRDNGVRLAVQGPGRTAELPHDLAHFVVESELGLADGFWGQIAQGRLFDSTWVLAAPRGLKHRRPYRPPKEKPTPVNEAEVLVRIFTEIWEGAAVREYGTIQAYLDAQHSPRTRSRAEELDLETIAHVCSRLGEMDAAWRELKPGESMVLSWPRTRTARGRDEPASAGSDRRDRRRKPRRREQALRSGLDA